MKKQYLTINSKKLYNSARKSLIEAVSSPSRGPSYYSPYPIFMKKGSGFEIWDVDENRYIDYMMAYSTLIHGHANKELVKVISKKAAEGTHFATAIPEEAQLADIITSNFPSIKKVRFVSTGTEASMTAVRLARAFTSKKKILKFEGHYHGWYDHLLYNTDPQLYSTLGAEQDPIIIPEGSGLPNEVTTNLVTVWNNVEELRRRVKISKNEISCIITEPVMANIGVIPPNEGYLKEVQEISNENDIPFILDETVTGFRTFPLGAQLDFGLRPDLTIFGKALGAGMPIAAYGGRDDIMELLEWGKVLSFGTQNAHRLSTAVAIKSAEMSLRDDRAALKKANTLAKELAEQISVLSDDVIVQHYGSIMQVYFLKSNCKRKRIRDLRDYIQCVDSQKYNEFANRLRPEGIFIPHTQGLHIALSTVHNDKALNETVAIFERAFKTFSK